MALWEAKICKLVSCDIFHIDSTLSCPSAGTSRFFSIKDHIENTLGFTELM